MVLGIYGRNGTFETYMSLDLQLPNQAPQGTEANSPGRKPGVELSLLFLLLLLGVGRKVSASSRPTTPGRARPR